MPPDDQSLGDLDPRWIAPIYRTTTGQEFLGLRAVQASTVGYLLPGIITITPRARYYPFYSWLLVEYGRTHSGGMSLSAFIKRREQIFVLANLAWIDSSDDDLAEGGLQGSNELGDHWRRHRNERTIPFASANYLKAKYAGTSRTGGGSRSISVFPERPVLLRMARRLRRFDGPA